MSWTVKEIIDGDTFAVKERWIWEGQEGERIRPMGYQAPEQGQPGFQAAKDKLSGLILHQQVDLTNCVRVDRGRLVCAVLFDGKDLASYFPEYQ